MAQFVDPQMLGAGQATFQAEMKAIEERRCASAWQLMCDGLRATAAIFATHFAEFPEHVGRVQLTVDQYSRMGVPRDSQKLAERQALLVEINRQIEAERQSIHRTITAR